MRWTANALEHDEAEGVLRRCGEASGLRPETCPWWALRDPYVSAVRAAYRWWKTGQLGDRAHLPAALVDGLATYDGALNAVQVFDLRAERENRDRPGGEPDGGVDVPTRRAVSRRKR